MSTRSSLEQIQRNSSVSVPYLDVAKKESHFASDHTLKGLADAIRELERAASILRRQMQAAKDKQSRLSNTKSHMDSLKAAGRAALALERDGIDPSTAAAQIAHSRAILLETVKVWQKRAREGGTLRDRAARDREILRMAARGWTNAKLARRFGLCERTISRIVAKGLR